MQKMKKVLVLLCVSAALVCMVGCGCGTTQDGMVETSSTNDSNGNSTNGNGTDNTDATRPDNDVTTSDSHEDSYDTTEHGSSTQDNQEGTQHNGTTEDRYDSTQHSDGVLDEIGSDIEEGVDDILGTEEQTTGSRRR